jgi:hypothetical protein
MMELENAIREIQCYFLNEFALEDFDWDGYRDFDENGSDELTFQFNTEEEYREFLELEEITSLQSWRPTPTPHIPRGVSQDETIPMRNQFAPTQLFIF